MITVYNNLSVVAVVLEHGVSIATGLHHVNLSFEELADIADAVEQHLEIESAAEYIDLDMGEEVEDD